MNTGRYLASIFMLVLPLLSSAIQAATLYVSPSGQPGWSRRLSAPNPQGSDGPFPSLVAARGAVRELRRQGVREPIQVLLCEGVHRLEEWRSRGQDGMILGDPRFADPHHGDFALSVDSPANQIGFRVIDTSLSGVREPVAGARVLRDLEYARADGKPLLLDLYLPENTSARLPVINEARLAKADPTTYIDPQDPPILIAHGARDSLVPKAQSELFDAVLRKAGVASTLLLVPGAGHSVQELNLDARVLAFFDRHLK